MYFGMEGWVWLCMLVVLILMMVGLSLGDFELLVSIDPQLNDTHAQFGFATGGNDFLLAVGAHRYPDPSISMGAVFLYYRANYSLAQVLYGQNQSQFGWLTRVNGNRMAVSAPLLNDSVGAVYIYDISSVH